MALGRFRALRRENVRFRGAFASFDEAVAHVRPGLLAGYDHDRVVPVSGLNSRVSWTIRPPPSITST